MPMTVPKRPMKGEMEPMVASQVRRCSMIGERFAGGRLRGAFERRDVARRPVAAGLAAIGLVDLVEHVDQRAGLVLLRDGANFLQPRCLAEGAEEARLCARARRNPTHLPRMMAQEKRLAIARRPRTVSAIGPLARSISRMALLLECGGGTGTPWSSP